MDSECLTSRIEVTRDRLKKNSGVGRGLYVSLQDLTPGIVNW